MQARDEGLLELDDPVGKHLDVPAHGDVTVRRLLSHTAGLQREPYGDVWDTLLPPDGEALLADLARAERVLPPGRRYHYSNLGVSVLGLLVARMRGGTWAEVRGRADPGPLGLTATTATPDRTGGGRLPGRRVLGRRPARNRRWTWRGAAPAAQLWSTAADMARWAAFLASPEVDRPGRRGAGRRPRSRRCAGR